MGSETSKLPERENQQQEDPNKVEVQGTRLYQYVQTQDSGKWELVSESATYGFYDQNEDSATSKTCWMLEVSPGDIDEKLTDNMGLTATEHERRVTFLTGAEDGSQIWAMRFPTTEEFHAFHESFENKHFENMYATDDREKALGEWSDVLFTAPGAQALSGGTDMMGWNAEMDSPRERPSSTPRRQSHVQLPQEGQISIVSMGAGARSFCVREATVDVLNNVRGGVEATGLSFECTPVKGSSGKVLTPSRLMLTNHERGLNALTKERKSSVFHTDIETGKVVSEWAFTKDTVEVPMTDICNDNKAAQLEDRDTFLGLDRNRLCRWDKRTAAGAVQDLTSELASPVSLQYRAGKDYSRNTNFSCINTSGDGFVVIGSDDGRVRFYNNRDTSLSRASTSIPSLGAAITHVDVTHDAQWVLATTDNYLMVIPTSFEDKKGNSTTGFQARMGPANVPPPRLLRLRPEDLAKLKFAKLEKARFTWETERGRVEKYIAATCGSHSIIWNFRQIKSHKPCSTTHGLATITDFYQVVEQPQSTVVDTTFMHENFTASPGANAAKSLVVATAHDVFSYGD